MDFADALPDYLLGEAVYGQVLIGPRTRISLGDTSGAPASLALSTTILGSITTGSGASTPALTTVGADIQVGSDEALIIEELAFQIQARDTGAKLVLSNLSIFDNASGLPVSRPAQPLPYTFAAFIGDTIFWQAEAITRGKYIRGTADNPGSFVYSVSARWVLQNTDGAGAHTYTRAVNLIYRRIQGLAPLVPRTYTSSG